MKMPEVSAQGEMWPLPAQLRNGLGVFAAALCSKIWPFRVLVFRRQAGMGRSLVESSIVSVQAGFGSMGTVKGTPEPCYRFASLKKKTIPAQMLAVVGCGASWLMPGQEDDQDHGRCLGNTQGLVTKLHARKHHTIVVNPAVIVFIPISHQFFYVIFSDGLSRCLQHDLQLLEINVAIGISV